MVDYVNETTGNDSAYMSALVVTPADGADLVPPIGNARPTRALFIGTQAGSITLTVDMADGSTVLFPIPQAAAGFTIDLAVKRVRATGTTAAANSIIALW